MICHRDQRGSVIKWAPPPNENATYFLKMYKSELKFCQKLSINNKCTSSATTTKINKNDRNKIVVKRARGHGARGSLWGPRARKCCYKLFFY